MGSDGEIRFAAGLRPWPERFISARSATCWPAVTMQPWAPVETDVGLDDAKAMERLSHAAEIGLFDAASIIELGDKLILKWAMLACSAMMNPPLDCSIALRPVGACGIFHSRRQNRFR